MFPESAQPGMEPVISVSMHSDGRYAFVELRTPEMATAALQLSGQVQLFGQSISVGRPSGYVDPGKAAAAAQAAAAALAAFQAADPTGRGSIPGASGQLGMVQMGMLTGTALAASPASAFICVEGMVTLDTLTSDTTYRKVSNGNPVGKKLEIIPLLVQGIVGRQFPRIWRGTVCLQY